MDVWESHRKAIESTYFGKCNIYEQHSVRNAITKLMETEEILVLEEQPCRISFSSIPSTSESENVATVKQSVKLFIAPEVEVKAGSKIVVTQDNVTGKYSKSGVPATYPSHQEIMLELFGGYA